LTSACATSIDQGAAQVLPETIHPAWKANTGKTIPGSPVIVKDIVVLMNEDGEIQAFDTETGELRWNFETPSTLWPKSLSSTLEDVLIAGENGRLLTMTTRSGLGEWELFLNGDVISPPYIDRYLAFTATSIVASDGDQDKDQKAELLAINASTGEILWRHTTTNQTLVTPARGGDQVYIGGDDGENARLYALSAAEGELRWKYEVPEDAIKALYANDEVVVILDQQGTLTALDGVSGSLRWRAEFVANVSWLTGTDGLVIFEDGEAIQVRDINTGDPIWKFQTTGRIVGQPIILNSELYLLMDMGVIFVLDPHSGIQAWQFQTESKTPAGMVIANNSIFITDQSGYLFAYTGE